MIDDLLIGREIYPLGLKVSDFGGVVTEVEGFQVNVGRCGKDLYPAEFMVVGYWVTPNPTAIKNDDGGRHPWEIWPLEPSPGDEFEEHF